MTNIFELNANKRSDFGKRTSRRLRRLDNKVPAIIYGAGKASQAIAINHDHAVVALGREAFYSHILTINIDGSSEQAVLKAVQRHAYKNKILHLDFQRVKAGEKITMNVPLHFSGEEKAPGVKQEGGVFVRHLSNIEIRCLPKDLPEFIEVNVSDMVLDQVLHLSQLSLPSGIEALALSDESGNDPAVIAINIPKAAPVEEETSAEEGEEKTTDAESQDAPEEDK